MILSVIVLEMIFSLEFQANQDKHKKIYKQPLNKLKKTLE